MNKVKSIKRVAFCLVTLLAMGLVSFLDASIVIALNLSGSGRMKNTRRYLSNRIKGATEVNPQHITLLRCKDERKAKAIVDAVNTVIKKHNAGYTIDALHGAKFLGHWVGQGVNVHNTKGLIGLLSDIERAAKGVKFDWWFKKYNPQFHTSEVNIEKVNKSKISKKLLGGVKGHKVIHARLMVIKTDNSKVRYKNILKKY